MKVTYVSDLHLEFGQMSNKDMDRMTGETLVIAGDTAPIFQKSTYMIFLEEMSNNFKNVVMVAGNHEFYHGNTYDIKDLFENVQRLGNVHVLNDDFKKIDDVVFIGGTLWSDIEPMWARDIESLMNDFQIIRHNHRRFTPTDAIQLFNNSFNYINYMLTSFKDSKKVVVTHHAPSFKSVTSAYAGSALNSAYASDLEYLMKDQYAPLYWIHGHMHNTNEYVVGNTTVLSNPRGYVKYEVNKDFDPTKSFEI